MKLSRTLALSLLGLVLLAGPASLSAQEPPRPPVRDTLAARDTLARDTAAAAPDTASADTVPPPRFGELFAAPAGNVAGTVFTWDRDALQREAAVTLGDLLELVPGVTLIRSGEILQPEGAAAFGLTRGRTEIIIDGFVADPLTTSTTDLANIELAQVDEVRVERRLDLVRVIITTIEAREARPYSRIEAATGEPSGSVFRGVFTAPRVFGGPFAFAIDRVDTKGRGGSEPADIFGAWVKWGLMNHAGTRGVQVELQQGRLRRSSGVPWAADQRLGSLVFRARNRFADGVYGELFAGRNTLKELPPDTLDADSVGALRRSVWQYGARGSVRRGFAWADAALRLRDSDALPSQQLDLNAGADIASLVHLAASFTQGTWREGVNASAWNVRAELGPLAGLSAFAELTDGKRGAPRWAMSEDSLGVRTPFEEHLVDSRNGSRIGLSANRFGISATAALVRFEADSAATFGLPYDTMFGGGFNAPANGLEVFGRVPLWPKGFSFTGNFNYWNETGSSVYMPTRSWRIALELHTLPLRSRNLEIFGRLEHQRREAMLERNPEGPAVPDPLDVQPAYTTMPIRNLLNGYLQIRVIDVRAFIHFYDLLADFREDLPGRVLRGPRILYGVKWQLFN